MTCCWFDYWNRAPGPASGGEDDYLTWFLRRVRAHDERVGRRTLHLLDVHYYPQGDVYNDVADAPTGARRLRSTRSLWDPTYEDESWIDEPIRFVPRMREVITAAYPGTGLAVSEWNFGADTTMNGALAIADVLGIFGREGVQLAAYWRHPAAGSPGYFAFKMHGNYDDAGSSFGGTAVAATTSDVDVPVGVDGIGLEPSATLHRYSPEEPTRIVRREVRIGRNSFTLRLPASSITLVELTFAG